MQNTVSFMSTFRNTVYIYTWTAYISQVLWLFTWIYAYFQLSTPKRGIRSCNNNEVSWNDKQIIDYDLFLSFSNKLD